MVYLKGTTKSPRAYSSVQCGARQDDNIELNSDLVYSTQPDKMLILRHY